MKVFICILATIYTCNATLLSLLGGGGGGASTGVGASSGGGGGGHGYAQSQGYAQSHGYGQSSGYGYGHGQAVAAPQVVKVILQQSGGYGHGGGGSGVGGGYGGDYGHGHGGGDSHTEVIKVIQEEAAPAANYGRNFADNQQVYAAGYKTYGNDHGYGQAQALGGGGGGNGFSLESILPQILQIVLQDNAYGGGFGGSAADGQYNQQLIAHFGQKGKVTVMMNDGSKSSYFKGGHVVQKGTLKVTRVEQNGLQGKSGGASAAAAGGGHGGGAQSYGNIPQGHPPAKSGW